MKFNGFFFEPLKHFDIKIQIGDSRDEKFQMLGYKSRNYKSKLHFWLSVQKIKDTKGLYVLVYNALGLKISCAFAIPEKFINFDKWLRSVTISPDIYS